MAGSREDPTEKPIWDPDIGDSNIGQYILIGVTYLDESGEETGHVQLHGIVTSASQVGGIKVKRQGDGEGRLWTLPLPRSKRSDGRDTRCVSASLDE